MSAKKNKEFDSNVGNMKSNLEGGKQVSRILVLDIFQSIAQCEHVSAYVVSLSENPKTGVPRFSQLEIGTY